MMYIFIFAVALTLGILIQRIQRFPIISTLGVLIGFVLPPLMTIDSILDMVMSLSNLDRVTIITSVALYSVGTSTPIIILKFNKINKMERHIKYSHFFVDEKIQNILNEIRAEFLKYNEYYGKDIFISLFYVKRVLFKKYVSKLVRVGHSGLPGILSENWDGVIKKYKKSSTGRVVQDKCQNFIIMDEISETELSALPYDILTWSKSNIQYRINMPFYQNDKVQFVISISGIDKSFSLKKFSYTQRQILLKYAYDTLFKYEKNIRYLDKYFDCVY